MSKGFEVPDAESDALKAVLREWKANGESWRDIGLALGYEKATASQSITNAVNVRRPGRDMAERIYARLGTTREAFLTARGLTDEATRNVTPLTTRIVETTNADRVLRIAAAMTPPASARDVLRVITGHAALMGSATDEDIARLLREPVSGAKRASKERRTTVTDDDFGSGLAGGSPPTRGGRKK